MSLVFTYHSPLHSHQQHIWETLKWLHLMVLYCYNKNYFILSLVIEVSSLLPSISQLCIDSLDLVMFESFLCCFLLFLSYMSHDILECSWKNHYWLQFKHFLGFQSFIQSFFWLDIFSLVLSATFIYSNRSHQNISALKHFRCAGHFISFNGPKRWSLIILNSC